MTPGAARVDEARALAVAVEAALAGGAVLRGFAARMSGPSSDRPDLGGDATWSKSARRDLATAADLATEREIVGRLRAAFPDHAIEAEEETHDAGDATAGPRWFVDPLDGTINFVHGLPMHCVSLGLWVDGEPVVAVVHLPRLGETFTARRGHGAHLAVGDGAPRRLAVAPTGELADAVLATGFPYRRNELEHDNLANFAGLFHAVRGMRRMGSAAIDLAYTAAGRLDGYWELHLSPHDVAAGGLLVLEAGGLVTDADGGGDWLRGGSIVAAGPDLHGAIAARIRH